MQDFKHVSQADVSRILKAAITKKRLLIAGGIVLAFLLVTPIATYAYFAHDITSRDRLMNRNDTGILLKDRNGVAFYEYGRINQHDDVPLNKISDTLEHAVIASEDHDFYHHDGFSVSGIARAAYANISNKDATKYGGSTITQQLVKNKLLSSSKNYFRKYQEVSMAIAVERRYTKAEILDMYLNSVYFGEGAFGVADAAKVYFNKTPAELNLAESSILVGLLPAPSLYSPLSGDPALARVEQKRVLAKMVENGYITQGQKTEALAEKVAYADQQQSDFSHAQHYAMMVLAELKKDYGEERITRAGFEVTTGLDLNWQKQAETIIKQRVAVTASAGGRNASLVAIDPTNGQIRALVGSVDWNNKSFGQVNMATALRQPGSSFKPIYYTEAIDKHLITAATILEDEPQTFGKSYTPKNYDHRYLGKMTARNALAQSRNIPAIEVMQKLGVSEASQAAQRMGLRNVDKPSRYGLSLGLGTAEVRLTNMTNAYAAFANQGEQYPQVLVTQIKDKYGKTIFKDHAKPKRVQSKQASYIISSILSDNQARAPAFGSSLTIPGRQVAVKTGTTNEDRDGWTIGFAPNLAVGVWVGNNEHEPMAGLGGSNSAGVIWQRVMRTYLQPMPKQEFQVPKDVVRDTVCTDIGRRTDYFIAGTEPDTQCAPPKPKKPAKPQPAPTTPPPAPTPPQDSDNPPEPPQPDDPNAPPDPGDGGDTTTPPDDGGGGTESSPTPVTRREYYPTNPRQNA